LRPDRCLGFTTAASGSERAFATEADLRVLGGGAGLHQGGDRLPLASELSIAVKPNPRHDHRPEHDALVKDGGKECSDPPSCGAD
jgi:hypothetical protein